MTNKKYFIFIFYFFQICSQYKEKSECDTCIEFTNFFDLKLYETQHKTYEGGTSYGQNNKLLNYADSELRLIEILERICDQSEDKRRCKTFLEKYEDEIEDWFKNMRNKNVDLRNFLCVEVSRACCPKGFYGIQCKQCEGLENNILCNGHGKCHGDGTRRGNGKCICDEGFAGDKCKECSNKTFVNEKGDCQLCHESCEGSCKDATPGGCEGDCKTGWTKNEDNVCIDDNECELKTSDCESNQVCVNVPGSYSCEDCHESCLICNGTTKKDCETCALGLQKNSDNLCVDVDECQSNVHNCSEMTYCKNNYGSHECLKCNSGCEKGCTGPSLLECFECRVGYKKDSEKGCIDIDECQNKNTCPDGKYCQNKNGGFECLKCDKTCLTCHGPGPHSCYECAQMHHFYKGYCQHVTKIALDHKKEKEKEKGDL